MSVYYINYVRFEEGDARRPTVWWWQAEGRWCDRWEDATPFEDHYEARYIADQAQARVGQRVRVIGFKDLTRR